MSILKRLYPLLQPYRWLALGSIMTLVVFTNLGLLLPLSLKLVIDSILPTRDFNMLMSLLIGLAGIYGLRQIFFYCSHYFTFYTCQRVLFDIRRKLIGHLQSLSLSFYDNYRTGKLIASLINDVNKLQQMINQGLNNLVTNTIAVICISIFLLVIDWQLALICFIIIPLFGVNFYYFKTTLHAFNKNHQEMVSEVSANLSEVFSGVRVVKSFANERRESRKFVKQFRDLFDSQLHIQTKGVICHIIADSLAAIGIICTLGAGAFRVWQGDMTVGAFVSFYAYLGMVFAPIIQLTQLAPVFAEGVAGLTRIFWLLDTKPEINDGIQLIDPKRVKGAIDFDHVNFSYKDKLILDDFNLTIEAGQTVALVGPSGSGKSTIANLLLRFYELDSGQILVDQHSIAGLKQATYHHCVGVVLQEPFLFSGTVAENISYGEPDVTREQVERAAKIANAHEFIMELDDGYETGVGERGTLLSGGQKQRIAIARSILRDPPIMILDEATSALDNHSEIEVQRALDNVMGGRTTIIIAHRLSTIRNADVIVAMDKGRIVETGTHEQLLDKQGLYADLYEKSQMNADDERGGSTPYPLQNMIDPMKELAWT